MHTISTARLLLLALVLLGASGCMTPRQQAMIAQELTDAADQIGDLRSDVAQLQSDVDSLKLVVAHQDTLIKRIAAVNGVPLQ
ncbi:MAG TPA: hypothetical protein VHB25_21110 [Gemmatimonadaceae bacterium]|nr:hypothetical protein [Gemmatimonadaceae bacterium]